eukprot:SAG25_NODE_1242_length_3516_cov_1.903131_1_plen_163_part_00
MAREEVGCTAEPLEAVLFGATASAATVTALSRCATGKSVPDLATAAAISNRLANKTTVIPSMNIPPPSSVRRRFFPRSKPHLTSLTHIHDGTLMTFSARNIAPPPLTISRLYELQTRRKMCWIGWRVGATTACFQALGDATITPDGNERTADEYGHNNVDHP